MTRTGRLRRSLRPARRIAGDLAAYAVQTGKWWVPVVVVGLAATALLLVFVKVAVPTAVYVFF